MGRKTFDRQFKIAAVKLVTEDHLSVSEVSRELSIHCNSLYKWINEYDKYGDEAFPGNDTALKNTQYEIKKLQRENKELRAELELLKKFQAFLKKKNV